MCNDLCDIRRFHGNRFQVSDGQRLHDREIRRKPRADKTSKFCSERCKIGPVFKYFLTSEIIFDVFADPGQLHHQFRNQTGSCHVVFRYIVRAVDITFDSRSQIFDFITDRLQVQNAAIFIVECSNCIPQAVQRSDHPSDLIDHGIIDFLKTVSKSDQLVGQDGQFAK